jgi:hypothetical protein
MKIMWMPVLELVDLADNSLYYLVFYTLMLEYGGWWVYSVIAEGQTSALILSVIPLRTKEFPDGPMISIPTKELFLFVRWTGFRKFLFMQN